MIAVLLPYKGTEQRKKSPWCFNRTKLNFKKVKRALFQEKKKYFFVSQEQQSHQESFQWQDNLKKTSFSQNIFFLRIIILGKTLFFTLWQIYLFIFLFKEHFQIVEMFALFLRGLFLQCTNKTVWLCHKAELQTLRPPRVFTGQKSSTESLKQTKPTITSDICCCCCCSVCVCACFLHTWRV